MKGRSRIVEVFYGPEAVQKLLYLVLVQENEKFSRRRLMGFVEIQMGRCHASAHTC